MSRLPFALQGLTWRRTGLVVVYCAIYGAALGLDPKTGGAPRSMIAYLTGFAGALAIFLPVYFGVTITANFAPRRPFARAIALGLAVVAGVAVGFAIKTVAIGPDGSVHAISPVPFAMIGWLGVALYLLDERDKAAEKTLHDEATLQLELGRRMSEAQLQLLQSQIEPHFLFNTLAHVRRLYQTNRSAGRTMIRHLSRYLGAAWPAMRESGISLGRDLDLAEAYLSVQQVRMGTRLAFEIDVPDELRAVQVPPMTVTTLVENAIKHGLSPLPEGGTVRVRARPCGRTVSIEVSDTGQGFQTSLGTGVGLANVRARLATLYGTSAQLSLAQNVPSGVTATIVAPLTIRETSPG